MVTFRQFRILWKILCFQAAYFTILLIDLIQFGFWISSLCYIYGANLFLDQYIRLVMESVECFDHSKNILTNKDFSILSNTWPDAKKDIKRIWNSLPILTDGVVCGLTGILFSPKQNMHKLVFWSTNVLGPFACQLGQTKSAK